MDHILEAFKVKRKQLQDEIKRIDRAEAAYAPVEGKAMSIEFDDATKLKIVDFLNDHDNPKGFLAKDIALGVGLDPSLDNAILNYLRSDKGFTRVSKGSRYNRFRLTEKVKPESATDETKARHRRNAPKPPKSRRRVATGGNKAQIAAKAELRFKIIEFAKKHKKITIAMLEESFKISKSTARQHLEDLVGADVLHDIGFDASMKKSPIYGRSPRVWESRIYEAPVSESNPTTPSGTSGTYRVRPGEPAPPYPPSQSRP